MKLVINDNVIGVVLSERNLRSLLTKLDHDWSACELQTNNCYVELNGIQVVTPNITLSVRAETDAKHYGDRNFPPGTMHPATEHDLEAHNGI